MTQQEAFNLPTATDHRGGEMERKPGKWYRREPFRDDDSGDIVPDTQIGPAHSVSWQRRLLTDLPQYETLTVYYFAATRLDHARHNPVEEYYVQCVVNLIKHTDPDDPGGSETWADYRYHDILVLTGVSPAAVARSLCDAAELSAEPMVMRYHEFADD